MRLLNQMDLSQVAAGYLNEICQEAIITMLNACMMEQLFEVNQIFKAVLSSDEIKNADSDAKKAALIAAILGVIPIP